MKPKKVIKIIGILRKTGVELSTLEKLPEDGGLDYEALGFPSQVVATSLFNEGVLRPRGKSMVSNSRGKNVLRTLWGRGVHFENFLAYWREFEKQSLGCLDAVSESEQPIAV